MAGAEWILRSAAATRASSFGSRISPGGILRPSMNLVTSQPSDWTKATTSGPIPISSARRLAACSTARSIPRSPVLRPPIRNTYTEPSTVTLKLRLVIPPSSATTSAARPGHNLSTAAPAASTVADGICLNGAALSVKNSSTDTELAELRARYVPRGITTAHPLVVDRASGAELWDVNGRRFIDFAGGIGVMNVGHGHPRVMEAVRAQLERATHTSFQVVMYESYLRLAERLCEVAPLEGPKKAIFFSTGAEAIENAVKIARAATGRPAVISFRGSFHGRTLLALSLTGSVSPYKQDFGPYATEIYQTPFPYAYRGWTTEAALADLDNLLESEVSPKRVAAIIIEPVLGEGGFVPAPLDFMRKLRKLCDEHGILLIADEIQTGFGRTGKFFAMERSE